MRNCNDNFVFFVGRHQKEMELLRQRQRNELDMWKKRKLSAPNMAQQRSISNSPQMTYSHSAAGSMVNLPHVPPVDVQQIQNLIRRKDAVYNEPPQLVNGVDESHTTATVASADDYCQPLQFSVAPSHPPSNSPPPPQNGSVAHSMH